MDKVTYIVLRPCLFFAVGEKEIPGEKLKEYYTDKALASLVVYGYLQKTVVVDNG